MNRDTAELVTSAALIVAGLPFKVGDKILFGKYKNKKGIIIGFGKNHKDQITVKVDPIPKGRKQTKEMGLFKIWTMPEG